MAQDTASGVTYFLAVAAAHKAFLGPIRHWGNLEAACEGDQIWVKGFTREQIKLTEVKTIPFQSVFYARGGQLFPRGSRLPSRRAPAVRWAPIGEVLPVELPAFNHNYFGIADGVDIRLVPSEEEREAYALAVPLSALGPFMESAPAVRLQNLQWTILNGREAFILGTPLLPAPGAVFWRRGRFLLPAGYDFEYPVLEEPLSRRLNPEGRDWLAWSADGAYRRMPDAAFRPLSISSFRRSGGDE